MIVNPFSGTPAIAQTVVLPRKMGASGKKWGRFRSLEGDFWSRFEIDVVTPKGQIVDHREGPSRSFMRNFGILFRQMIYTPDNSNDSAIDDGGVSRKFAVIDLGADNPSDSSNQGTIAAVADIAVGGSNAAVTATQHNLQGTVLNAPVAVITTLNAEDTTHRNWQHEATILNNTGNPFDVKEAGLFAHLRRGDLATQNDRVMMMRDVFTLVTIANGNSAVATYVFDVAV